MKNKTVKKGYKVYAALHEDINSGLVWISPSGFSQRAIVCIENVSDRKKVYCEALEIDGNYLREYNKEENGRYKIDINVPTLVINQWYRKQLGDLSTLRKYNLQITTSDNCYWRLKSCLQHPQIVVKVATWLGIISVALGMLGFILGLISILK
ncbi:MAG: hypothetical protein ABSA51_11335 [Anaerolineaceae bacterium]|jgi:hypothetical protein